MRLRQIQGMTLIEVLIALAVLAISLTALVKATTSDIRDTDYLRDKTIALWVATNSLSLVQLDLVNTKTANIEQNTKMLDRDWYWTASISKSPNPHVNKVEIVVRKKRGDRPVLRLSGFKPADDK